MDNNKTLITEYLRALSGQVKTTDLIRRYVADEKLVEHIVQVESAFPAYELRTQEMLADGDRVVVRAEFHGVHQGPFAGIPPTGRSVFAGLIIIYRIENGRIAEHWMQFDLFGLLQQLQSAPAAATA